tara:strand:- start:45 stop:335 length:291 start_codon:yes stop_codon:yes gene_type:complete
MKFIKKDKNMRLFIYKTLFIFICILIVFKLTIGSLLNTIESKIENISSKENISLIKKKIIIELNDSLKKDKILKDEDAILIKKFLNKISKEISNAN